ncbi:MAG: YraN family protein [Acidimicrobiales bacterium]
MPNPRQVLGRAGEDLAALWYTARGYEVLARNFRCPEGEADLILRRRSVLVVCEVKARSSDRYGSPAEAVTIARQRRLRRTAIRYLRDRSDPGPESASIRPSTVRFDVAEVMNGEVSVIEDAF